LAPRASCSGRGDRASRAHALQPRGARRVSGRLERRKKDANFTSEPGRVTIDLHAGTSTPRPAHRDGWRFGLRVQAILP
jgi:hypothetical protein